MATKRINRVIPRLVAQQESYLNHPAPRSTASLVEAAPEPRRIDSSASRLNDLAQAMAHSSKALSDFLTMEKSYEETNRMENSIRAQMGLEPAEGKGHLKYGSRAGYLEGKGLLAGQEVALQVQNRLNRENYGIDTDGTLPTPDELRNYIDSTFNEVSNAVLGPNSDPSIIRGASPIMTQVKLESRVRGMNALMEAEEEVQLQDANIFIRNYLETEISPRLTRDALAGEVPDAAQLRQDFSDLSKVVGEKWDIDRDVAMVSILDNTLDSITQKIIMAGREGADPNVILDAETTMYTLIETLSQPDSDGIRIDTMTTPEVSSLVDEIYRVTRNVENRGKAIRALKKEEKQASILSDYLGRSLSGEAVGSLLSEVQSLVISEDMDGTQAINIINTLRTNEANGNIGLISQSDISDLMSRAYSGRLTGGDVLRIADDLSLPVSVMNQMLQGVNIYSADVNRKHAEISRRNAELERARVSREREETERIEAIQDNFRNSLKDEQLLDTPELKSFYDVYLHRHRHTIEEGTFDYGSAMDTFRSFRSNLVKAQATNDSKKREVEARVLNSQMTEDRGNLMTRARELELLISSAPPGSTQHQRFMLEYTALMNELYE